MVRQPLKGKFNWRVYGAPAFLGVSLVCIVQVLHAIQGKVSLQHEFLPIYDEANKLTGFTHPALVEQAGDLRRTADPLPVEGGDAAAGVKKV